LFYLLKFLVVYRFMMVCILFSSDWHMLCQRLQSCILNICSQKGQVVSFLLCSFPMLFIWVCVILLLFIRKLIQGLYRVLIKIKFFTHYNLSHFMLQLVIINKYKHCYVSCFRSKFSKFESFPYEFTIYHFKTFDVKFWHSSLCYYGLHSKN
jgi:hypothetical protein